MFPSGLFEVVPIAYPSLLTNTFVADSIILNSVIGGNRLTGTIPESIGNLFQLSQLYVLIFLSAKDLVDLILILIYIW